MNQKFIKAVFLQFSGIMGAGIFALPYLFYHSGFNRTLLYLALIAGVMAILNYTYITVIVHTPGDHQISGYAHYHLGKQFKAIACLAIFMLGFGALLAYMNLASIFINLILPGSSVISATTLFLLMLTVVTFLRIKPTGWFFEFLPLITCCFIFYIFLNALPATNPINTANLRSDLPFLGALVFSLNGFTIIPELEELLRGVKHKKAFLKLSSLIGLLVASIVYIIFIYSIIKISGTNISVDTVSGLFATNPAIGRLLAIVGILVVFKSSLNFILIFKEIFFRDLGVKENNAYVLSALVPFTIFLFRDVSYVSILSFTGSVAVTLSATIICLMRLKLPHKITTDVLSFLIIMVFIFGILSSR